MRFIGAALLIELVAALLLVVGVASVAAQDECTLSVEPRKAQAGSEFTLSGSGYTPDTLVLQRGNSAPVTIEVDLGSADPFEIPIGSRIGDEGEWTATASDDTCEASVTFRVTLQDTGLLDDVAADRARLHPLIYLAVIIGGFALGTLIGRQATRWSR